MGVNINTIELIEILNATPAKQNVMLTGRHGIGKSEILTHYYKQKGMTVIPLFLGQMSDPGDLIGLPSKDVKTGKTEFMPPYWFPVDGKPVVLFLDELNRARPEVLQTIMDLALNRKLAGRELPEGSVLISAVNDGEEYQLTDLDPALVSRFNIYNFRPTVEEWLLWGEQNKLDKRVLQFIQQTPMLLDGDDKTELCADSGLDKSPDRRAWHKVSDCICNISNLTKVHHKQIAGIVGAQAASKFIAFLSDNKILSAKDVLMNFEKNKETLGNYKLHEISVVNESICRYIETQKIPAKDKKKISVTLDAYVEWLKAEGKREVMAHFASAFDSGKYPRFAQFIMTETSGVYQNIIEFINQI